MDELHAMRMDKLHAMRMDANTKHDRSGQQPNRTVDINNPNVVKTKGKPKNLSSKKGKTQCAKCKNYGHNRATCDK